MYRLALTSQFERAQRGIATFQNWGVFWLGVAVVGAAFFFQDGIEALASAWSTPEYSHGPLIPLLSAFLFLRQLRDVPVQPDLVTDRGPGIAVLLFALLLGGIGQTIQISDLVAYAMILWVGGMILISFGWRQGRHFWPTVLFLVFMLPLPAVLYYGLSTDLQGVSSQIGVFLLQLLGVPVFLDGNIIDLGVYKLQVAEACSGLRYLFPILSFSYLFTALYRGPLWHKAVLLLSAAPITVLMNSVRIAIAGVVVDRFGTAFVEGLTHLLEGWVIFITCVLILFALARLMMMLRAEKKTLVEALDLDFKGIWPQMARLRLIQPSAALIGIALLTAGAAAAWQTIPPRPLSVVSREPLSLFPDQLGDWTAGSQQRLAPDVEKVLGADDYYSVTLSQPNTSEPVDLFIAWYRDQMDGGTHSPTVCLPGAGWEIASLDQVRVSRNLGSAAPFTLNRAVIQKGLARMMVYYWYEQQGQRTASSYYSKILLTWSKVMTGRSDGALVRLITPIAQHESNAAAEARLQDALRGVIGPLPRFVPGGE
jgi:exosortase D (VPLPA-CTERM-specific)